MKYIFDLETFKSIFCAVFKNIETGEILTFEISSRKNQIKELITFLKSDIKLIGYNNLNFDYPVLHWMIENINKISPEAICNKAQDIINAEFSAIQPWKVKIPQLDLFRIWHFNNKAKSTSLKYLESAMRMDNIEDLPYGVFDKLTTDKEFDDVINYCIHDVEATFKFYQITIGETNNKLYSGKNKVAFRSQMSKKFNTNFLNANDVKIGEEINKLTYLKLTGKTWADIKHLRTKRRVIPIKPLIPSYIKYKHSSLIDLYTFIIDKSINCYNPKLEYKFNFANNTWKFALGGIHTEDKPRIVEPNKNQMFNERDVSSMYPSRIINSKLYPAHLGIEWLVGYTNNRDNRLNIKSKPNKTSEDFQEVEVLKLALNGGGYGKTGEETNWQADPIVKYTTTIQCQLDILLLADMLWETGLIKIESGNTDGINILYNKIHNNLIESICKKWEYITKSELETTEYSKVIRTSVNDYMAIKPNGNVKLKGDFEFDKELHKNHSQRVVPYAINQYYINNTPVEDTILNHTDIFDFCKAVKSKGGAKYVDRSINSKGQVSDSKLQKVNRYIVSTNGTKLIKIMPPLYDEDGNNKKDKLAKYRKENPLQLDIFNELPDVKIDKNREFEVEAGWKTTILNNIDSKNIKDYDINYNYYVQECKKIINQIE